ncbi:PaaI family thioesterase [Streptomyces sp. NPDC047860]|uniref:PaaI family thioesterase n=1 Tax=Streptomyces sp. NPDC047860 TaxID=3155743 RepID=UPI0033FFD8FE
MTAAALDRLETELARCPYHDFLLPQAVAADADEGTVVVRLPYRPEFRLARDSDFFHGGVLASLVDITAHAAVAVRTGRVSPTVDLRIDYLRAAAGGPLTARGKVLRAGRSVARADVEVLDASGALVAAGRGTFSTFAPPPAERGPETGGEAVCAR